MYKNNFRRSYVPDIDKRLFSFGQLIEKGFKLLFGDKYCRIFDSIEQEILQVEMRGKSFSFSPSEDAHKSCKTKDELAGLFTRSIQMRQQSTIPDPSKSVEDTSRDIAKI